MSSQVYQNDIDECIKVLNKEGTILYPTDTIWGLGCDATSKKAVSKIYKIKHRFETKSFIILLADPNQLHSYINHVPPIALDLIEKVNTPLTIIYEGVKNLPTNLCANDDTIAIRIVKNKFVADLINEFGKPIVSTSANISGMPNPLIFAEIDPIIIQSADYVVKIMRQSFQQIRPSTIIKVLGDWDYTVIRS